MMIQRLLLGVLLVLAVSCVPRPPPPPVDDSFADRVIVHKAERRMELYNNNQLIRAYSIRLGKSPVGHKMQEGDQRTPEGEYILDWRNPNSRFHKSIHISYPNARDRAFAEAMGVNPGSHIMIHGLPNQVTSPTLIEEYMRIDWTDGCIAVSNEEMDEIWELVADGTPILILP